MKTIFAFVVALLGLTPVCAQTLRPEVVRGTLLGGVTGAVIGHNSGDLRHNGWRGAAIGAGAGMLLGSIAADANDRYDRTRVRVPDHGRTYVYRQAPLYHRSPTYYGPRWSHHRPAYNPYGGYSYSYGGYHRRPAYYGSSGYYSDVVYADADVERGDYRGSGLLLGALAGAVIGNNSGDLRHNGWRGAAYGAGLGYLLGSVAEHSARRREAAEAQTLAATATPVDPAEANIGAEPPAVTAPVAEPSSGSSMSAANSLFGRK